MLFVEFRFFIFFLIVAAVFWAITNNNWRKVWLLAASYVFYGAWDWRFLSLILYCSVLNYVLALVAARNRPDAPIRTWLLWISVVGNLSVLFFFKYFNFFAGSLTDLAASFGAGVSPVTLELVLPVGISFYTFQAMSYYFDVHRNKIRAESSFLNVALYIGFFPQLVAGPIVRAADFLPQLERRRYFSDVRVRACVLLFLAGFFKKACIADNLAPLVDAVFAAPELYDTASIIAGVVFYAVQIYGDFSGYSDMAIATAGLLGYHIPINFNAPYFSVNITDFWRRWHISLSSWLRDYLYIPLGGSRFGPRLRDRNLMLTMVLGGLWHGASYNFIIWGFLHGLALIVRREWAARTGTLGQKVPFAPFFSGLLTFYWVCIAWIFFRAKDLPAALEITQAFTTLQAEGDVSLDVGLWWVWLAALATLQWAEKKFQLSQRIEALSWQIFYGSAGATAAILIGLVPTGYRPFIYFQF
jgi:D-alanyl-lipoteichoic acid acyltransferase DltB (MBOAT superfamily)